jgi:hypothetical protein
MLGRPASLSLAQDVIGHGSRSVGRHLVGGVPPLVGYLAKDRADSE